MGKGLVKDCLVSAAYAIDKAEPLMLPSTGAGVADKSVTQPAIQPGTTEIDVTISLSYEVR